MSHKRVIVAIDGPAGAGKSTIAKRVAEKLGYVYINTGAMYRAVALWALRLNVGLHDMHRLEQLANEARIELTDGGSVLLNGEDVTDAIRDEEVSRAASKVAAVAAVRRAMVSLQRAIAAQTSVVMEGRDIGTVVFPQATVKIFLDADSSERARRRSSELKETAQPADIESVTAELRQRDARDRERQESPLVQAPDAELLDTTGMTLEQVEENVLRLVRARTSNGKEAVR